MTDKLNYYDILGQLIPGILLLVWVDFCIPEIRDVAAARPFPDGFVVLALTAAALFLGQVLQALSSLVEPGIYKTWGGRPSDKALESGVPSYVPLDTASRIKGKLQAACGEESSARSLFIFAMQQAESAENSRVPRFNSVYAYHRNILTLAVLSLLLFWTAQLLDLRPGLSGTTVGVVTGGGVGLVVLLWHRTRQRANYYVREILLTAERSLKK